VARTGGDEFMVIVWGIVKAKDIHIVADKLVKSCAKAFKIGNIGVEISCSIGGAICPDHGLKDSDLIQIADQAMYKAKQSGKNCYHIHEG